MFFGGRGAPPPAGVMTEAVTLLSRPTVTWLSK
jgi:hypothetical protein